MLIPELDKLRDKTLSFWCKVLLVWWWYLVLVNKEKFSLYDTEDWNRIDSWNIDLIVWHPLTRWRIEYLHQTRNNDTDEYWSIHELFLFNPELYDKSELERMQSPHREELKKLLIQFSNYL